MNDDEELKKLETISFGKSMLLTFATAVCFLAYLFVPEIAEFIFNNFFKN